MQLSCESVQGELNFEKVELSFASHRYHDVFSAKNNKTLNETIAHHKYARLSAVVQERYPEQLHRPLGMFLLDLKEAGDEFYLRFLNKYGDGEFSKFSIVDGRFSRLKGIYTYRLNSELLYIGRCRDSMAKRINQGYGKIHPKNCFLDGQATNCHLNGLVTKIGANVELWLFPMLSNEKIVEIERELIRGYCPPWNIQR